MNGRSPLNADLVLEGGGVKGIALAGAVSVLEARGYRFPRVAGTSAGAIVGALVAAGASSTQLREFLRSLNFRDFRDPTLLGQMGPVGVAAEIVLRKGWCRGDRLTRWLTEALKGLGVSTFADLRLDDAEADPALRRARDRAYRFVAMASDVTHGELVRLPWAYRDRFGRNPDEVPVAEAVRASMAIPFYFRPARCLVPPTDVAWLVDGGMLSNFPIDVFDRTDGAPPRWPTFGIKLSSSEAATRINRVRGVVSLSRAMLSTVTGFYDRLHINQPDVLARTIFIDTGKVRTTQFDLSRQEADELFERGQAAATRFLDGGDGREPWRFEEFLRRHRAPASLTAAAPAG